MTQGPARALSPVVPMAAKLLAWFDLPEPPVLAGSAVSIDGWVVGDADPGALTVRFAGRAWPTHRVARPDVRRAFPGRTLAVGFRSLLDLAGLAPGPGRLELEAGGRPIYARTVRAEPRPGPPGPVGLFVLGAARCGTTSIYRLLEAHPDVCMSVPKEPLFFEAEYEAGPDHYLKRYFGHWNGQRVLGEARHRNLFYPWIPPRIAAYNPRARLVVVVRHPIERLLSQYLLASPGARRRHSLTSLIERNLERLARLGCPGPEDVRAVYPMMRELYGADPFFPYLDTSDYAPQLEVVFRHFPREQVLVLEFGELVEHPGATARRVLEFAGLAPERHPAPVLAPSNPGNATADQAQVWELGRAELEARGTPRVYDLKHTFMIEPDLLEALRGYFRPRVPPVEALLGRRLDWLI